MRLTHLAIGALTVIALAACTDEKIVYRDRPTFNPPPDSVNGFLGYFTISTKQTTCGNCHVGVQRDWSGTRHAAAWVDFQGSGTAPSSSNKCPTVSELGKATGNPAAYSTVPASSFGAAKCARCPVPAS